MNETGSKIRDSWLVSIRSNWDRQTQSLEFKVTNMIPNVNGNLAIKNLILMQFTLRSETFAEFVTWIPFVWGCLRFWNGMTRSQKILDAKQVPSWETEHIHPQARERSVETKYRYEEYVSDDWVFRTSKSLWQRTGECPLFVGNKWI
jgi:hypothetical protein